MLMIVTAAVTEVIGWSLVLMGGLNFIAALSPMPIYVTEDSEVTPWQARKLVFLSGYLFLMFGGSFIQAF